MLPKNVLYYGREAALPVQTELRAGPLAMIYEQGDLRYIRLGEQELLRRIYVAVRDRNWGTVPPRFSDVQVNAGPDSFLITYAAENRQGAIDFTWVGTIRGTPDGTITFEMDGTARSTFWRNRIGFCVLHPAALAGRNAKVARVDGKRKTARFPVDFSADQPVMPFAEMRAIAHEVQPGLWAEVRFSGDIFEMEDQRNWTDASYKTFSTPLRLPYPVEIQQGTRVRQTVTLRLRGDTNRSRAVVPASPDAAPVVPVLTVQRDETPQPMPLVGLGAASHGRLLTEQEIARLRALRLDHLRVDLLLNQSTDREALARAAREAEQLGVTLDLALLASPEPEEAFKRLRRVVVEDVRPPVRAWLCYPAVEQFAGGSPVAQVLSAARAALHEVDPSIPFCAGTNTDFIFMKRSFPPLEQTDRLTFAICPQVHAFDNASLVETLEVQGDAVRSARRLSQGRPVCVSPVTLKMRFNPYATGPAPDLPPGALPPQVDARQMSLFGAAWTLGSFKYLAEAGAASVTYYETSGWCGVMEAQSSSPAPEAFPSLAGGVFPLYHVLADIGEFTGGRVILVNSSHPLRVVGMLLQKDGRERMLLANFSPVPQRVRICGLRGPLIVRVMGEHSYVRAVLRPEAFRAEKGQRIQASMETLDWMLNAYAVLRVDQDQTE